MPMASVSAEGPMPKALSTRRTSPLMPGCRHQGRACPLRRARMTSNRSEAHKSELQSLMRRSYAVFFLKKKKGKAHDCTPATKEPLVSHNTLHKHKHNKT